MGAQKPHNPTGLVNKSSSNFIDDFCRTVLTWDYFNIREYPQKLELKRVKDTYTDVNDYLSTFEPLLFEEVNAQIAQFKGKEGEASTLEQKICQPKKCTEADRFHFLELMYMPEKEESFSQNDILLVSTEKFVTNKPSTYAFALVEHRQKDSLRIRMFLVDEVQVTNTGNIEPTPRSNMRERLSAETYMRSHVSASADKAFLHISKVCSLSTILREYVAMRSICSNQFKDVILRASDKSTDSDTLAWEIPKKLMESIESNHNESQLGAIRAGLSRKPFVLIQGPPGTGKTQTILGLLNAILHAVPARMLAKGQLHEITREPELPMDDKCHHWRLASPWLIGANLRDKIMPVDGDDGFFPFTGNELKPEVVNSKRKYRVRVLVCAPSNSALDEIVLRVLNTGVRDENDCAYNPKIVRVGLKAHHSVQAVSMDYLVEQKLASMGSHQAADKQKNGASGNDVDSIRASILDDAVIVFSTLSYSGSTIFTKLNHVFDIVIIDEAAQAVEPAILIPLATGCKQVFLVGDPVQLPATVISPVAGELGYSTSLFERFQKAGYPVFMLKTQYRMHPEIRGFPSRQFYEDALEDGADVKEQTTRNWHDYSCFKPFCFFDIKDGAETEPEPKPKPDGSGSLMNEDEVNKPKPHGSGSLMNKDEVNFALLMYRELVTKYPELKSSSKVAIISPYQRQVKLFRERFKEMFGVESQKVVDINTVDGFQGREKDVAIFSCVRASKDKGIGFVSDFRRMNVGITRARSCVLVVGSASTLKKDEHWKNLIDSAVKNETFFEVTKPYTSFFSEEHMKSMKAKTEEPDHDMFDGPMYGNDDNMDQGMDDEYGGGDDDDMGGDDD